MIKVNLLRNVGVTQTGGITSAAEIAPGGPGRQVFIKLFCTLLFPIGLIAYEKFNISLLDAEVVKSETRIKEVEKARSKYGDVGPKVERYTKERKRVDEQLSAVRKIARTRLRDVKALDALQSLLPDQTWFQKVVIDENNVKLFGYTMSEDGISILIRALENSPFFSQVEPKSAVQENLSTGPAKKFEMDFHIGKSEQDKNE